MTSKVQEISGALKDFTEKMDRLVGEAKSELDGAARETTDSVTMVTGFAKEVRAAAADIRGMLAGTTNSPPPDAPIEAPPKKGIFGQ